MLSFVPCISSGLATLKHIVMRALKERERDGRREGGKKKERRREGEVGGGRK